MERVELISPLGRGVARVAPDRVEEFKANGWREAPKKAEPEKAAPARRKRATKPADADNE